MTFNVPPPSSSCGGLGPFGPCCGPLAPSLTMKMDSARFCDIPRYSKISVYITFNSKAGGRRPTAGPDPAGSKGPKTSAGARRRGALAPQTSS